MKKDRFMNTIKTIDAYIWLIILRTWLLLTVGVLLLSFEDVAIWMSQQALKHPKLRRYRGQPHDH